MKLFVLDCSMYMAWYLQDEKSDVSSKVFCSVEENKIIVPGIWIYEVANTLSVSVKRKRLSVAEANKIISYVELLPIAFDKNLYSSINHLFQLSNEHRITAYDAAYIELSLRLNLPIATLDKDLIKTAKKLGIPQFQG